MLGTTKLDLKPLFPLCIFNNTSLILILVTLEAGMACVCCSDSTTVQTSDFSFWFLVSDCHSVHSLVHADLLFIEESPAHSFSDCIGSHSTGVAIGRFCLDAGGDSCIEGSLIVSNCAHCSAHVCLLFIECIQLICKSGQLMRCVQVDALLFR